MHLAKTILVTSVQCNLQALPLASPVHSLFTALQTNPQLPTTNPLLLRQAYPIFLTNLSDVLARLCLKKGACRDFVNEKLIST